MLQVVYNKMRSVVELGKRSCGVVGRAGLSWSRQFCFCKASQKNSAKADNYQDWEYCKMISSELKSSRVSAALSLLFQSYLNDRILDIQIYNSILQAVQDGSMDCSYSEIVYLLYREHFPPHLLLLNPMNKLTSTSNQHLLSLLKQDFQTINHPFPAPKKSRRELRAEKQPNIRQVEGDHKKQHAKEKLRRGDNEPIKPISIDLKQMGQSELAGDKQGVEDFVKMKLSGELKQALEQFNSEMLFSKINLFDVEIEMNQPETDIGHEQFQYEQDQDEGNEDGPGLGLFELDISKIKIGRVEFICNPPNDKSE